MFVNKHNGNKWNINQNIMLENMFLFSCTFINIFEMKCISSEMWARFYRPKKDNNQSSEPDSVTQFKILEGINKF